jgi:hypothetical protein
LSLFCTDRCLALSAAYFLLIKITTGSFLAKGIDCYTLLDDSVFNLSKRSEGFLSLRAENSQYYFFLLKTRLFLKGARGQTPLLQGKSI